MATDWLPRFADIKSIEELSALLAYPMLIAAFVLQSGLSIHSGDINIEAPVSPDTTWHIILLAFLFVVNAAVASVTALLAHMLLSYLQLKLRFPLLLISGGLLMAFSLVGVLGRESSVVNALGLIDVWYYALFVFGVYFVTWEKRNGHEAAA